MNSEAEVSAHQQLRSKLISISNKGTCVSNSYQWNNNCCRRMIYKLRVLDMVGGAAARN